MVRRFFELPWRIIPDWLMGNRLKILMYHSIAFNPLDPHATSPRDFQQHMKALQTKRVVGLEEALKLLHSGNPLHNIYAITFDDALLDFYTDAIPILRNFNYPVTMFVPLGLVGGKAVWDSYDKSKQLMTWEQIEECQQWGVNFGSHTVSHVRLPECSDIVLEEELRMSLRILKDKLNSVIPALAYPGGFHNERIRQATRSAGYSCALGASSHWGNGPEADFFQLRRERFEP